MSAVRENDVLRPPPKIASHEEPKHTPAENEGAAVTVEAVACGALLLLGRKQWP